VSCRGCDDEYLESGAVAAGVWPCDACGGECATTNFECGSAAHVDGDLSYPDPPPTCGDHNGCWASWGVHTDTVAEENWVHNLEHGGVVILYDCPSGCSAEVDQLSAWVGSLPPGRAILTPYANANQPFTAVAWGHRLELGCFDLPSLQSFYDTWVGHGPEDETSEPGSGCM
jgi:hypothetical protein